MVKIQSKNMSLLVQSIDHTIYMIRGQRVMLDEDLAKLYGVETRILNQAIRRNRDRFPDDFMFQLSDKEFANLTSQIVISRWGGRRRKPFVFTEHGTVMLASVLKSRRAIEMSIKVVKAFVRLRHILASHKDMEKQLTEIRSFMLKQANQTDREFKKVWKAIGDLSADNKPHQLIGFEVE